MLPNDQLLCVCIRDALICSYKNPADKRTSNYIIRSAAYCAKTQYYSKIVTEKYPLDELRAIHFGRPVGSYLSKSVIVISDSEYAALLWRIRQLYRSMKNDNQTASNE